MTYSTSIPLPPGQWDYQLVEFEKGKFNFK